MSKYNAIDIGNFIVYLAAQKGKPINYSQLMKMIYYVVADYLQTYNELLFDEPFYKHQFNPLAYTAYEHFKIYGNNPINKPIPQLINSDILNIKFENIDDKIAQMQADERLVEVANLVVDATLKLSHFQLLKLITTEKAYADFESIILNSKNPIAYTSDELKKASYLTKKA